MFIIETRQLKKHYGQGDVRVEALRGVDLQVPAGEFLAIMGPSGSGKSTLLSILGGIEVPTSGQVLLEGTDLASLDDDARTLMRRRRIGFIFQSFNLLPTFTAEENVSLPLLLDGLPADTATERAMEMLEEVGIAHRCGHLPSQLSGGEQQRVAVARALAIRPAMVLADEPTGNLDSVAGEQVTRLLRRVVDDRGHTIVMVTHDPNVAAQADRVIHFRDGMIEREKRNGGAPAPHALPQEARRS